MKLTNFKRIWMITDIHFGVRSNSLEWLEIQKSYFNDFFISLLKKEFKNGDMLWILGDVYDQRQSINSLVLNESLKIFQTLANILPIHILVGNHDIYYKSTNEVNTLIPLSFIPNITIYEEPIKLDLFNDKTLFVMPWRKDLQAERGTLLSETADLCFTHTGYSGALSSKYSQLHENTAAEIEDFSRYKRVYSGHIHYRQEMNNIKLVGCPFHLTRSDLDNDKGVYIIDLEKETEQFIKNDFSPIFLKISLDDLVSMTEPEFMSYVRNNFVDVMVESEQSINFPFDVLTGISHEYRQMNFKITKSKTEDLFEDVSVEGNISNFNVLKMVNDCVGEMSEKSKIKKFITSKMKEYYEEATN